MSRRSLAALFVACALFLAACGDDGGSSSQDTANQGSDGGSEPEEATGGDGDGPPSDLDTYFSGECAEAVEAFNAALVSAGTSLTPGGDGTAAVDDAAEALQAVAEAAPDEIADDFDVLADAYSEYAQALADAGIDFSDPSSFQTPEAIAALQSLGQILDQQALEQASGDIEAWFDANCG